jgi:ABC-type multidrug transport system permease subunit
MTDNGGARHPLLELTLARLREFLREPEAIFWVFFFPILLAAGLGIAFRTGGESPVHAAVRSGPGAEQVMSVLAGHPGIRARTLPAAAEDAALRNGDVEVIVVPGDPPAYRFDPTRPESRVARLAVDGALQRARGRTDAFVPREERVEVVGSRYIDWLIPGLLGLNIMGTGMWGIGFSLVTARSKRILKRLAATPMSRAHYLLAQILARLVFLVLEVGALLLFAWLAFGVPVRGSIATLALVAVVGTLSFGGLALLIAARPRTIEAVSGWMNFVMMPMWVLSGVFFSSAHFPAAAQPFIRALPLTALNDAFRGVMLDGTPASALGPELLVLGAWGLMTFGVALKIFRWR